MLGNFAGLHNLNDPVEPNNPNDPGWKTAKFFLDSTPLQPVQAIGDPSRFRFEIEYPAQQQPGAPLPIDKITLRFVQDGAAFEAEREADRIERGLVRRNYLESSTLDQQDYPDQDYVVYRRNYLEKIYTDPDHPSYNTVPNPNEITDNLATFEVCGQREPVTFAIYAFQTIQNVRVQPTDLKLDGGGPDDKIPKESIRTDLVIPVDKRWAYGFDAYYGRQPWYLDSCGTFDVAAGPARKSGSRFEFPTMPCRVRTPEALTSS